MPTMSDYSCASIYSYHDQSPAPSSPRTARMQVLAATHSIDTMSPESAGHRLSLASGPVVRHFEPVSWDDEHTWSRTSTMTGISSKVKEAVKSRRKDHDKDTLQADALHRQLSVLSSSATETSTFSDVSSAHLQTVTSRRFFESASAVSIALSSASASSYDSSNNLHTPHKSPTLLDAFDGKSLKSESTKNQRYAPVDDARMTPRSSSRHRRPTISQPYSLTVLSTPMDDHPPLPNTHRPNNAASPSFNLISLADAQQRERDRGRTAPRATRQDSAPAQPIEPVPVPSSPQSHRLKGKKSGIMKFLNKTPKATRNKRDGPSSPGSYQQISEVIPPVPAMGSTAETSSNEDYMLGAGLLQLRPVSMNMSRHFPDQYLAFASPPTSPSPGLAHSPTDELEKERLAKNEAELRYSNAKKAHQLQVYELEAQIRELKLQLAAGPQSQTAYCEDCGHERGSKPSSGIMNRARVKTAGPRGVFGSGSLYEA